MACNASVKLCASALRHYARRSRTQSHQASTPSQHSPRTFSTTTRLNVLKPFLLADIGEGITECQIIQWFVQPGARVEQFDKICEVQSDKASVEITSRFDGIIKKLHYEKDDVAKVGKPLLDIDIQGDISPEDEAVITPPEEQGKKEDGRVKSSSTAPEETGQDEAKPQAPNGQGSSMNQGQARDNGRVATLATPAVRRMIKDLNVNITDIEGTGKDGRVLKEDVQKFAASQPENVAEDSSATAPSILQVTGEDKTIPFTAVQSAMFRTMTRSLSIPHFLYTDIVDFTGLSSLRRRLNERKQTAGLSASEKPRAKISGLAIVIKAISLAFQQHPQLNAHLDTSASEKPVFTLKASHNIGIAVDSPSGLMVPVIKNVQSHTVASLAAEIARLSDQARTGKLTNQDLQGATFTVSNVGSIGGAAVAPVIVSPQVAIVGIGRARTVPAFADDGTVVKKEECVFSWSADHRVLDGATVARAAETVKRYLENVEDMLVELR